MTIQEFVSQVSLVVLSVLYLIQLIIALFQGLKTIEKELSGDRKISFNLFKCLTIYDDGIRNIWVFLIVALFLPVCLSSLSNLSVLIEQSDPRNIEANTALERQVSMFSEKAKVSLTKQANYFADQAMAESVEEINTLSSELNSLESKANDRIAEQEKQGSGRGEFLYFLCLACIGVLMTLEFSYIHSLRRSAASWTAMLLSALVLDLIALLVLVFVIRHPQNWASNFPARSTLWAFGIATTSALCSSFLILLLARTAGALHDGQVNLSEVEQREPGMMLRFFRRR